MKLSLTIIAKDRKDGVIRLFDSTKDVFDSYILVDTGSNDNEMVEACQKWAKEHKKEFLFEKKEYPFVWVDGRKTLADFSMARNDSLELARKAKSDYIFWADSDDILINAELIPQLADMMEKSGLNFVLLKYEYAPPDPITGKSSVVHYRERLVRMNQNNLRWIMPVHENLIADGEVKATMNNEVIVRHQRKLEEAVDTGRRNKLIMEKYIAEHGEDNVDIHLLKNYAFDAFEHKEWTIAEKNYKKAFERLEKENPQNRLQIEIDNLPPYIICLLALEKRQEAFVKASELVAKAPQKRISHLRLAECAIDLGMADLARAESKRALSIQEGDTIAPTNQIEVELKPLQLIGESYLLQDKIDKAIKWYDEARRRFPNDQTTAQRYYSLLEEKDAKRTVKALNTLQLYLLDRNEFVQLKGLRDSVPSYLQEHPAVKAMIEDIDRDVKRHTEKTVLKNPMNIVFWIGASYEPWTPKNIKQGIGGSEEMVINMARELAKIGNKVTVFNWCGNDEGVYDNVAYINFNKIRPEEIECDVVILWRSPQNSWIRWKAKKVYLWLHDTYYGAHPRRMFYIPNKVMVLTEAHKKIIQQGYGLSDDVFYVTRNGIDTSLIPEAKEAERNPYAVIYGSSYDRGLEQLLEMWGDVKKEVPQAELHVCYGWNTFDAMMQQRQGTPEGQQMALFRQKIEGLLQQEGVIHHGRIGQDELSALATKCGVWAYPTWFSEISCISAMRFQACGAIPVVTPVAALKETVQHGYKIGTERLAQIKDKGNLEKFRDALILTLKNKEKQERVRAEMMPWAKNYFSMTKLAQEWNDYFKNN